MHGLNTLKILREIFANKTEDLLLLAKEHGFKEIAGCGFSSLAIDENSVMYAPIPVCRAHLLQRYSPHGEETLVLFDGNENILYRGRDIFLAPSTKLGKMCQRPNNGNFQCPYGVTPPENFLNYLDKEFQVLSPQNIKYAITHL